MNAAPVINLPVPSFGAFLSKPRDVKLPKSILLYGLPGSWKTSIAASIIKVPKFKRVLFIDVDNGSEVLAQDEAFEDIDILHVPALEDNAFAKLNAVIDEVCKSDLGYDAVVLDTLDVAQDIAEKHFKAKHEGNKNTFAIYGELGQWTDEIVRKLHDSNKFTAIITAHAKEQTSESGAYRIIPRLSGSSKDTIGGIPSIVAYLSFMENPESGKRHNIAVVGESDKTVTKNRYGLPQSIIDLTLPKLYGMIEELTTAKTPIPTTTPVAAAA